MQAAASHENEKDREVGMLKPVSSQGKRTLLAYIGLPILFLAVSHFAQPAISRLATDPANLVLGKIPSHSMSPQPTTKDTP